MTSMDGDRWMKLWGGLIIALLITLVGAVIGVYARMGSVRVELVKEIAELRIDMEREHGEIRERLVALETKLDLQRGPSQAGGGGQ